MKLNSDYRFREIAGCYYLIPTGRAAQNQEGPFQLTETAAWILQQAGTGLQTEEIARKMTEEYEVDAAHARAAVKQFLSELRRQGVLVQYEKS